jgi:hypothetical protein
LLLQGCAGRTGITIDSNPQGADILADGKNIGKTPMKVEQDDVFPPRWYGATYMVKGDLEIKKSGCDPVKMKVNDQVLSKDITADLECRPGTQPSAKQPAAPQVSAPAIADQPEQAEPGSSSSKPAPALPAGADAIENRLQHLKGLRDRGVITADEYAEQRKRILDSI